MAFYRKKPIVIEAVKLTEKNYLAVHDWIHDVDSSSIYHTVIGVIMREKKEYNGLPIKTLEGIMVASIGDYVIKGIKGEFYPCKPDVFDKIYEAVE